MYCGGVRSVVVAPGLLEVVVGYEVGVGVVAPPARAVCREAAPGAPGPLSPVIMVPAPDVPGGAAHPARVACSSGAPVRHLLPGPGGEPGPGQPAGAHKTRV